MKALYPPLSYALFIAIGIAALSMIMVFINNFTDGIQRNYAYNQLEYTADVIKDDILKLYSTGAEGRIDVNAPTEIAGKQYTIELNQNNLTLSLFMGNRLLEVNRSINIDASLSGRSYAPVSVEMEKLNGDVFIRLV
jgi:hypothetical protein